MRFLPLVEMTNTLSEKNPIARIYNPCFFNSQYKHHSLFTINNLDQHPTTNTQQPTPNNQKPKNPPQSSPKAKAGFNTIRH